MDPQQNIIARLRSRCQADDRVVAALLYGSFATGEADAYSDVDCAIFFDDAALGELDRRAWTEQVAPVQLFFTDDFGHHTAIFDQLVRGELHFLPRSRIDSVSGWRGNAFFPALESALLVDRTGELASALAPLVGPPPEPALPEVAEGLVHNFVNLMILGGNLLGRGELARALDLLSHVHRKLLHMVRLVERSTAHWPTPSRRLEQDISPASQARFRACTSRLDADELRSAFAAAWRWGMELAAAHPVTLPPALLEQVTVRLAARD